MVIPAYNEGPHVAAQVRAVAETLRTSGWEWELIVVDDGSADRTAEEASGAGARVLRKLRNEGYGAALKTGIAAAKHGWILITDADGTYPTAAIPQLLEKAARNEMVVGARIGKNVHIPLVRRPAKWFLTKLASYLAGLRIPDLNSGLRLMRKPLVQRYEHLLPQGFSFTTTITLSCACNGHPMEFVAIDYAKRLGASKIKPRHAYDFLLLILRTIVLFHPLKFFLPLGGLLFLAGAGKFAYDCVRDNLSESAVLALLGALIVWCVGLLADQNARMAMKR
ncbi:MAG: glycosyltransferase family 2 protein [Planctomycetes bacterium]|nr:glycosyltransferase family 2 protein [Planctomycetota bacterium]